MMREWEPEGCVQRGGAAAEKALSHQVWRLVLMVFRVFAPVDLRQRVGALRGRRSERLGGAGCYGISRW